MNHVVSVKVVFYCFKGTTKSYLGCLITVIILFQLTLWAYSTTYRIQFLRVCSVFFPRNDIVVKAKKRPHECGDVGEIISAPKKPIIGSLKLLFNFLDLITIQVGQAAKIGERAEMQDAHIDLLDFKTQFREAYSGEAYALPSSFPSMCQLTCITFDE